MCLINAVPSSVEMQDSKHVMSAKEVSYFLQLKPLAQRKDLQKNLLFGQLKQCVCF